MIFRAAFCLLRVVLPFWVGAAVLFAINGSAEQRFDFEPLTPDHAVVKDQLALIRFPAYYALGFSCVGTAIAGSAVCLLSSSLPRRRLMIVTGMLTVVMLLMVWDYNFIYAPLQASLDPPGQGKDSHWIRLHATSMITNLIHVSLSFAASLVLCWPVAGGMNRVPASGKPVGVQ